ncbi:MAG: response regulator [Deltaproteobacteria bacterium]|nr:response regulator [Deltaproteobacteria bacterium]
MKKKCSILLVDTHHSEVRSLEKALKKDGHSVLQARDVPHAFSILEFRAFDLLIVDVGTMDEDGLSLMSWAASLLPKPRIVATGQALSSQEENEVLRGGASLYLSKPVAADKVLEFIDRTRSRSSFSGTVDRVDLIEYIQFVMLGGKNTVVEVTSSLGTRGRLFLVDGNIVHAVCGVLQGEQALYRCLCFKEGEFEHLPWQDPEEITINKPGEFLLMEAIRKRDEAWGEWTGNSDTD